MIQCRKTRCEDIEQIMIMIKSAQDYFKSHNIDQWQNGYPNKYVFINDIEKDNSYIFTHENKIIATAMISFDGEPTYHTIDGQWISDEPYIVIHRIAVNADMKGNNIAGQILTHAQQIAASKNIHSIRIDTHRENQAMQRAVLKFGFTFCGIIRLSDGAERLAYQFDF